LAFADWRYLFERLDPGVTGHPVEHRQPYMDLRMVRYLLSIPPIPWCSNKHLLRAATKGVLPDVIRQRPKTPLAGDPVSEYLKSIPALWRVKGGLDQRLSQFIDMDIYNSSVQPDAGKIWANWTHIRPIALSDWLRSVHHTNDNSFGESNEQQAIAAH
jgi:asparagine synthase (glutamine-hydrolysing)